MRWPLAFLGRVVLFWGVWFVLLALAVCGLGGQELDGTAWGRIARLIWFVAVAVLLMRETSKLSVVLFNLQGALTAAGKKVPPRPQNVLRGGLPVALLALGWLGALELFSPWIAQLRTRGGSAHATALVGAVAWSFATLLVLGLALGGLSLLWFRAAARGLPAANRPVLRPVLPWTVAAWSAACLPLALFGLPDLSSLDAPTPASVPRSTGGGAWGGTGETAAAPAGPPVELLVRPAAGVSLDGANAAIKLAGAQLTRAVPSADGTDAVLASTYVVSVPAEYAIPLAWYLDVDDREVAHVELNAAVSAESPPARPCGGGASPLGGDPHGGEGLTTLGQDKALLMLALVGASAPVAVGIVDTGVAGDHADLSGTLLGRRGWSDARGHGTATAGAAGAIAYNRRGIASFNLGGAFVRLRSYPALAVSGGNADDIAEAIEDATDDGVGVLNLSFGSRGSAPEVVEASIRRALARGVLVVAAAGNDGRAASENWPANIPGVVVVGALSGSAPATFSNRVDGVGHGLWAPGDGVCTLAPSGYTQASGTSVAAPLVSGLLAAMQAACPSLPDDEAVALLERSGTPEPWGGAAVRADEAISQMWVAHPECGAARRASGYGGGSWDDPYSGGSADWGAGGWPRSTGDGGTYGLGSGGDDGWEDGGDDD